MDALHQRAARVRLAAFDVDGVLTDGTLLLGADGAEHKNFHVHDGFGLVLLLEHGLQLAVISSRNSPIVAERMRALGVQHVRQGVDDKHAALGDLLRDAGLGADAACFTGDDLPDLPAMQSAGLGIAVADAHPLVRAGADWVTSRPGGRGAVREVCELLLRAQGAWDAICRRYLHNDGGR
jgi:3-deoxy-D-manno-octulosonate 8-phosphate phosphatase (KDO 8-P phosphatase)